MVHDDKAAVALIVGKLKPKKMGEGEPVEHEEGEGGAMLACAEDLIEAVKSGDAHAVAAALTSAFHIADSMPHVEGEHEDKGEY